MIENTKAVKFTGILINQNRRKQITLLAFCLAAIGIAVASSYFAFNAALTRRYVKGTCYVDNEGYLHGCQIENAAFPNACHLVRERSNFIAGACREAAQGRIICHGEGEKK